MLDFPDYIFAFATMVCTTVLLAIGSFAGFVAGRYSHPRWVVREIVELRPEEPDSSEAPQAVAKLKQTVAQVAQPNDLPLLTQFDGSKQDHRSTTEMNSLTPQRLSAKELSEFTAGQYEVAHELDVTEYRRYGYDCEQLVMPSSQQHEQIRVRCHDIAVDGISFFLPQEPHFRKLAITLGSLETRTLMAAKVGYTKAVYMHGQHKVLVGCEFLSRLGNFNVRFDHEDVVCEGRE